MHFIQLFLVLLIFPSIAVAASQREEQAIISAHDVLRGHFIEERHLNGFKAPVKSEGRFVVAPEHGLIWGLEKPFPSVTVITPAGLAQIINGVTVTNLPTQKIPFMLHLYEMLGGALTGNWSALGSDFVVTREGDSTNWQVRLEPRDVDNPAMPFKSIDVRGRHFVERVVMIKADGDSDALTFFDQSLSSELPTAPELNDFNAVHP